MGLFSKLRSNMSGGVHLRVQAPGSVPSDQVIPVNVDVTTDNTQTITAVKVELKAQAREEGFSMGNRGGFSVGNNMQTGNGMQANNTMEQTVAQAEDRTTFTINPGETKTVSLQLYLNGGTVGMNPNGMFPGAGNNGAIGNVLNVVSSLAMAGSFEHINYVYSVHAYASVEGHNIGPSDKQPIQILPPTANPQSQPAQPQPPQSMTPSQPGQGSEPS